MPAGGIPNALPATNPVNPDMTQAATDVMRNIATAEPQMTGEVLRHSQGASATMPTPQQYQQVGNPGVVTPGYGYLTPKDLGLQLEPVTGGTSLLKDIGSVLLSLAPGGANVEDAIYGGKRREYQAAKAEQIKQLEEQIGGAKTEAEAGQPPAEVAARPLYGMGGVMTGEAAGAKVPIEQQKADIQSKWNDEQYALGLGKLSVDQQRNQITQDLGNAGIAVKNEANKITFATREDAIRAMETIAGSKTYDEINSSLKDEIWSALGHSFIAPPTSGAQPVKPGAPTGNTSQPPARPKGVPAGAHWDGKYWVL